jgi:hypothetical protein
MSAILGVPPKEKIYTDALWEIERTLEYDQTDAEALRLYVVENGGTAHQWGSDHVPGSDSDGSKGTTIGFTDRADDLGLSAGRYTVQFRRVDATGSEETIREAPIHFTKPADE